MRSRALAATLLAAVLAACGGAAEDDAADRPSPTEATSAPTASSPDVPPALAGVVDAAITDLSDRLDVAAEEVTVVSAQAVTWPDTSLGCPQPDQRYAQVVTDGVRVRLAHDGSTYAYHAGGDQPGPFLCEDPRDPVATPTS